MEKKVTENKSIAINNWGCLGIIFTCKKRKTHRCDGRDHVRAVALQKVVRKIALCQVKLHLNCKIVCSLILFCCSGSYLIKIYLSANNCVFFSFWYISRRQCLQLPISVKGNVRQLRDFLYLEDAIFDYVIQVNSIINFLAGGPRNSVMTFLSA